ncbi:hypothetical protein ACWCL1_08195 [Ligilactobacillus sp. LYQ135]
MQFKKYYMGFNNHKLSAIEKLALMEIFDRMLSSRKRKEFFDKSQNDYYVIYTIKELSEVLETSPSTVKNVLKSLTKKGWLIIKRVFHRNNLIFISPDKQIKFFSEDNYNTSTEDCSSIDKICDNTTTQTKSNLAQGSNLSRNQNNNKQTNNYLDTVKSHQHVNQSTVVESETDSQNNQQVALNGLKYSLIHHVNLPIDAVTALFEVSNNQENEIKANVSLVLQAKAIAAKKNNTTLRFEQSGKVQGSLGERIKYIFNKAQKVAKNKSKYIKQALINFFDEIINPTKVAKPVYYARKGHFQEKMPSWYTEKNANESDIQSIKVNKTDNEPAMNEIQRLMTKINQKTPTLA